MYNLESKNLKFFLLFANQLIWLITDIEKLKNAFNLKKSSFSINLNDFFFRELNTLIAEAFISQVKDHPDQYMWYTHWLVVERNSKTPVGGIWFSGEPDIHGKVFLSYFIDKGKEGLGYGTESVACLKKWSVGNNLLKMIIADTKQDNKASHRFLEKNGFEKVSASDDHLRWIFNVS